MAGSKPIAGWPRASCLLALVALAALLLFSRPDIVLTHSGDYIFSPSGTATIDGVQGPGEWDAAAETAVFGDALPGTTLLIMNDASDIYIALRVTDGTLSSADSLDIRFDGAHNGALDDGDDRVSLAGNSALYDGHWEAAGPFYIGDTSVDGAGSVTHGGAFNFFELSHPLNSGDGQDLAVASGDTIGVCVSYFLDGVASSGTTFPPGCFRVTTEQSLYADLTLGLPVAARLGDVNCDSAVSSIDALLVLQLDAGLLDSLPCDHNADMNGDGAINAIDAALILQYVAGLL